MEGSADIFDSANGALDFASQRITKKANSIQLPERERVKRVGLLVGVFFVIFLCQIEIYCALQKEFMIFRS